MLIRALVTAGVVLVASLAEAQSLAPRAPWHAVVASPRAELPAVTIDLGYPGPYVPSQSSPIVLHAIAGDLPFDGYIGFHFRVSDHRTYDTPVIARAVLRPHEAWTFSTFVTLRRYGGTQQNTIPREIAIEWRDRSMTVKGFQSAGVPPWTQQRMPLRIAARENAEPASVLGRSAYVEQATALSDRAQWYAGFADVVTPLDTWIDLPRRMREAILGSGINVVFFGLPRSGQQLDAIDRALLPISFDARQGSYRAPWPYGNSATVATPLSWVVKSGTYGVGNGALSYMVRSAVATWVADESGVSRPLPATMAIPIALWIAENRSSSFDPNFHIEVAWPRPAQFLRVHQAAVLALAATLISVAGWLTLRRRPRAAITVGLLISAMFLLAARDRIRPRSGRYDVDVDTSLSPSIVDRVHLSRSHGPSPLPEEGGDAETMRTSITTASEEWGDAEVRTSSTPVSMGLLSRRRDWDAVTRSTRRHELGDGPEIRIRSREAENLVLDYKSTLAVNFVWAEWLCGEKLCWGETAVRPGTHGGATIRNRHLTWPEPERFARSARETTPASRASRTRVTLIQKRRVNTRIFDWLEPAGNWQSGSFLILDREMVRNGSGSFAFALPQEVSPTATALISVKNRPSARVNLVWATGSTTLVPTGREGLPFASRSYLVPPAALPEILANGGIVNVTISSDEHAGSDIDTASIEIWEKKP